MPSFPPRDHFVTLLVLALLSLGSMSTAFAQDATPAASISQGPPPASGPGSDEVVYPGARMEHYGKSRGGFWIWEPTSDASGATPVAAEPLPVVLHFNGCCGGNLPTPEELELWFKHIAQQGYVVIAPVYNQNDVLDSSLSLFEEALAELEKPGHAAIDLERFAVTSYSFGSNAAAMYTSTAASAGLPVPQALFVLAPCVGRFCPPVPADLTLPAGLKAVVMGFDIDEIVGVEWPQYYFQALIGLPVADRNYVEIKSDSHGTPALLATHTTGVEPIDTFDRWAIWKISAALLDCAFNGSNCEYALGNTPEQRSMGSWSDGVPVTELLVSQDPIADAALPQAAVSESAGTFAAFDATLETPKGMSSPQGLDFAPDGGLYVVDSGFARIQHFDQDGVFIDTFGEAGNGEGRFAFHNDLIGLGFGDLAIADDGSIFVADTLNARVQKFDANRNFLLSFGADQTAPGALTLPGGIAVDNLNGRVLVTDFQMGVVNSYDLDGNFLESWGSEGPGSNRFTWPTDVAIGPDGTVFIAESGRSQVHLFSSEGEPIARWGGAGEEPGRFIEVWGLDVDAEGNLLVAEWGGNRVQIFSLEGMVIGIIEGTTPNDGVTLPNYLAVAADGSIYVAESGTSQISRFVMADPEV